MNRILALLAAGIIFFIIQPGFGQRMKGNVSSYKESYHSVKDNFGKLKPGIKINDSIFHDRQVNFDQKGNIVEWVEFNPDGSIAYTIKGNTEYADNNIETLYAKFDPELTIDRKPFVMGSVKYSSGEMCDMSYKNDSLGRPSEENIYDLMGREILKITFIRDYKGKIQEYEFSDGTVERYTYDNKGNKKELITRHGNSKPTVTSFIYDEDGNLVEMNINNYFKSNFKFQYENYGYKYVFDKKGNWTERIEFEGGRPLRIVIRTIEYSS